MTELRKDELMPTTPTYALPYPEATDPADVPADLQELVNRLEAIFPTLGAPVGTPLPWLVTGIPAGYREFDGSAIVQATHPKLYALFGATMPDLRGRVMMGQDAGHAIGTTGGAATHTLTVAEMPAHTHPLGMFPATAPPPGGYNTAGIDGPAANNSGAAGADQPHNNLPPYRTVRWITVAA